MGIKSRIPGTQAFYDRHLQRYLANEVGDADGLALVEWEDGSLTLRPVVWESSISAIVDPETRDFWFARGRGSAPKMWAGVPIWRVYAGNAGVVSTEACLLGDLERHDDVIDVGAGDELPDDLYEAGLEDPNGGRSHADDDSAVDVESRPAAGVTDGGSVETDGGTTPAPEVPDSAAVYDLRPPDGYDGIAIDVRDADDFDPWPVSREDAKAAAEWFEQAAEDGTDTWMKGFLVGILVTVGLATIFLGGPWIAGQIAGGGGGGGGGEIDALLPLLAIPGRSLLASVRSRAKATGWL